MLDIESIINYMPHRYPFLLVDRVLQINGTKHLRALKNVTINEPFFQGHFPSKRIMPGVLIIESFAQACILLHISDQKIRKIKDEGGLFLFSGIEKAKFIRQVVPGDSLILDVELKRLIDMTNRNKVNGIIYLIFDAKAYVEDQLAASATLKLVVKPNTSTAERTPATV